MPDKQSSRQEKYHVVNVSGSLRYPFWSGWDPSRDDEWGRNDGRDQEAQQSEVDEVRDEKRRNAATNKEFNTPLFSNSNAQSPDRNRIPQQRKSTSCKDFHVTKHLLPTSGSITDGTVGLSFGHPL